MLPVLSHKWFALVCFPSASFTTAGNTPTWQRSSRSCEDYWESREEMGTRDKERKDYLTLSLSPPAAASGVAGSPSSLSSSPLPSSSRWACQPLERQSDVPLAAGYWGLIKGGWQRRTEPSLGGSWTRAHCALSLQDASDWKWCHA